MTTPGQSAFNLEPGAVERDRGIEQVSAHAESDFITAGRTAIEKCCFTLPRFTTDDVWAQIPEGVRPHEPRAMAAIMKYAEKNNWAYPLEQFRPSNRREAHRGPKRVWRSMLYGFRNALQPSYEEVEAEPVDERDRYCSHGDCYVRNDGERMCMFCGASLGRSDDDECEG